MPSAFRNLNEMSAAQQQVPQTTGTWALLPGRAQLVPQARDDGASQPDSPEGKNEDETAEGDCVA